MNWWLIGYLPIGAPAKWVPFQGTQAQAQAQAQLAVNGELKGPYASKKAAEDDIKNQAKSLQQTPTGAEQAVQNATNILPTVGNFFGALTQANTWLRVGEGLLGVILIAIGVAKLSGAENIITKAVSATPVGRVAKSI